MGPVASRERVHRLSRPTGSLAKDEDGCIAGASCNGGVCKGTPDPKLCDDGLVCTLDICSTGKCEHELDGNAYCYKDPGDPCTVGMCTAGQWPSSTTCKYGNTVGTTCDDDNICTSTSSCLGGQCQGGIKITCDDKDPCTVDSCNQWLGCQTKTAYDGDWCAATKVCKAGVCVPKP